MIGIDGWMWWLVVVVQVVCLIHVLRHGRPLWWFLPIILMPVIGCVLYVVINRRSLLPRLAVLDGIKIPLVERLNERQIERAFRQSDTLDNRIAYAHVLINRAQPEAAIPLLSEALQGPLKNHVELLFTAARSHYACDHYQQALRLLTTAEDVPNNDKIRQRYLLAAMCHQQLGDIERAEYYYTQSLVGTLSEEARLRYGLFLSDQGRVDEAQQVLSKIFDNIKTAPFAYRREQAQWVKLARQALRRLKAD